jgi:three-Cys-motif partner protein
MAKKTFHKEEFDEGTISKLELFKEYFKESFPVFVHSRYFNEILIIDFFAGQGLDVNGVYGTALNILNEISAHCSSIIKNGKKMRLILNDKNEADNLQENAQSFLESCQAKCHYKCIYLERK